MVLDVFGLVGRVIVLHKSQLGAYYSSSHGEVALRGKLKKKAQLFVQDLLLHGYIDKKKNDDEPKAYGGRRSFAGTSQKKYSKNTSKRIGFSKYDPHPFLC